MSRYIAISLFSFLVLGALPVSAYTVTPLIKNLDRPWSLAFLPDGDYLITEKTGALVRFDAQTYARSEISNVPDVFAANQGGLLDVALHPDFIENQLLYISYAYGNRASNGTRVARARLVGNALDHVEVLFTVDPFKQGTFHYGGRLLFLPDQTFLLTTGDGYSYLQEAQDLTSLLGKVVRLRGDGSIPGDNPFVGRTDARPEIFTYGHRNPQGLAYDRVRNEIVLHEHGPRGGDEINILVSGANYGWPAITYGIDYSGAIISPYTEAEGMEQPLVHWTPSIAPSGLTVYSGLLFPNWNGDYFVGALAQQHLRHVVMSDGQVQGQSELLTDLNERIRDVRTGPDGALYILTDSSEGQLLRLAP